jgi:4-hydroxy-3-methylbut-2-enyl diphosphate reductase IspH
MFGDKKVSLEKELWERVKRFAVLAGYSSPDEFVAHVLEKELAGLKTTDSDDNIRKKLKGLGYIE